jgi:hypothetical protein
MAEDKKEILNIPESLFELTIAFQEPMLKAWIERPYGIVETLYQALKPWGVTLGNAIWEKDPKTIRDARVAFEIPKASTIVRAGLETLSFTVFNPDWESAPQVLSLFETVTAKVVSFGPVTLSDLRAIIALHVMPGSRPFVETLRTLVDVKALGPADMYGFSIYNRDSSMVLDKSVKYNGGVFVRLERSFPGTTTFKAILAALYADQGKAFGFLGIPETQSKTS